MKTQLSSRDLAWILVVVTVFGFAFVTIKWALADIPPFMLAALRFLLAALPACLFVRRPAMPWRDVAAYGFVIGVCQFSLLFLGMKLGMPAGMSALVIQVQVFFTVTLAVIFLHDRVTRVNLIAGVIAFAGIVVLAVDRITSGMSATFAGFALVIGSALAWAVGNLIAKRATTKYGADVFALVVWSSLVPPLPLAILSYAFEGGSAAFAAVATASAGALASALFLAWGATLFGFASWAALLHRYPTALVSPFALLIPVAGFAGGAIFQGETLSLPSAAGVVLVFAGLALNVFGPRVAAGRR